MQRRVPRADIYRADGPGDGRLCRLTRFQPALSGLMDGSLSTLAPISAVALATHRPLTAFSPAPQPPWARE